VKNLVDRYVIGVGTLAGLIAVLVVVGLGMVLARAGEDPEPGRGGPVPAPAPAATSPSPDAAIDTPAESPDVPVAGTGTAPFAFGTLETQAERAATESARGIKVAMIELSWSAYEPAEDRFDEAYARRFRDRLQALRGAGMRVTLGLGLHYTPGWIFQYPDSRFVDQRGVRSSSVNLIFNQRLRGKAERYLARIDRDLGLRNFWAVRLNSGAHPEVLYPPGGSYWAFDRNAQNGPDLPPTMAANPRPGWKPGDRSIPARDVQRWADWYVRGLDDVVGWQMRFLTALGFTGYFQILTPGAGTKPRAYARDVAAYLPDGVTGVGAVWHKFYANLPQKHNVVAYVTSMADEPGRPNLCTPGDRAVPLADPRVDNWPATRWLTRVAREYGLLLNGENPGWNIPSRLNAHYTDTSDAGMMASTVHEMISCGFQGMYWAHEAQLWDGTVSFDRYADWISKTNGGHNPAPPGPM